MQRLRSTRRAPPSAEIVYGEGRARSGPCLASGIPLASPEPTLSPVHTPPHPTPPSCAMRMTSTRTRTVTRTLALLLVQHQHSHIGLSLALATAAPHHHPPRPPASGPGGAARHARPPPAALANSCNNAAAPRRARFRHAPHWRLYKTRTPLAPHRAAAVAGWQWRGSVRLGGVVRRGTVCRRAAPSGLFPTA